MSENNSLSENNNNISNYKKYIEEKKGRLSPLEYKVTQEKATERPYSNKYNNHWEEGVYLCIVCDTELFYSKNKFKSNSGWPAFTSVVDPQKVKLKQDLTHVGANLLLLIAKPDLARLEVTCKNCGSHLGHLFEDGPPPTKLRYCVNSSALSFKSSNKSQKGEEENSNLTKMPLESCNDSSKICLFSTQKATEDVKAIN